MYGRILRAVRVSRGRPFAVLSLLALLLAISPTLAQSQDGKVSGKVLRQIGVMEKIFGQVLVDSPNFLVSGRGNVRGTYLDEFGVLLTMEASLVGKDSWDEYNWRGAYRIETDENGRTVIILPEGTDEDDWDGDEWDDDPDDRKHRDDDGDRKDKSRRSWSERKNRAERRLYSRGKVELRDAIIDYGDTLTGLRDNQWIAIASFLRDSRFFIDEKISRHIMKVRMKDLRQYSAGKIDEDELRKRIVEEEY